MFVYFVINNFLNIHIMTGQGKGGHGEASDAMSQWPAPSLRPVRPLSDTPTQEISDNLITDLKSGSLYRYYVSLLLSGITKNVSIAVYRYRE